MAFAAIADPLGIGPNAWSFTRMLQGNDMLEEDLLPPTHCCKAWCKCPPSRYCGKCNVAYCPLHAFWCGAVVACGFCKSRLYWLPSATRELAAAKAGEGTTAEQAVEESPDTIHEC